MSKKYSMSNDADNICSCSINYNNNINMSSKIKFMNRGKDMASPVLHGWLNYR